MSDPAASTKHRPSKAYWRLATWCSSCAVGHTAACMSSPDSWSAWRARGIQCSQQTSPPTRPTGVSTARRPSTAPVPQTMRSLYVGTSLR